MADEEKARERQTSQRCRWERGALRTVANAVWVIVLSSCASDGVKKSDYTELKLGQRIVRQTKDPFSIKSSFQKDVFRASETVKTSAFKSGEFKGKKKGFFASKDQFKAGTFSQAGKASRTGDKTFTGADDKSRLGDSTYKTGQNRLDGQMSRSDGQASSFSDDKFDTSGNAAALERTSNVKRPLILNDEAGYSEDQVKKLLNKS